MKNEEINIYVKGNPAFPTGVFNRLIMLGGNPENPFTEAELANPANIFYIDFYNDNLIRKIQDDSVTGSIILAHWKELQPFTYIDEPKSLPDTWDRAYEECVEVQNYIKGYDEKLDKKLDYFGRCIVLRNVYRQGWEQKKDEFCYYIDYNLVSEELEIIRGIKSNKPLSFQDIEIAKMFLTNFENIINECKELI